MYIFFSGDLHFFAILPANFFWGDTYMYKYKYIYICVCICICLFQFFIFKILHMCPKMFECFVSSMHKYFFLHSMGGFWLQIIVMKSIYFPAPLKDHNCGFVWPLKEAHVSCSCHYWRFLLSTLDGWLSFSWLSSTEVHMWQHTSSSMNCFCICICRLLLAPTICAK